MESQEIKIYGKIYKIKPVPSSINMQKVAAMVDVEVTPDVPPPEESTQERVEGEIGDILFVLANIARRWGVSPEEALRQSTRKFQRRFEAIEAGLVGDGRTIDDATLVEMEEYYQAAKRRES